MLRTVLVHNYGNDNFGKPLRKTTLHDLVRYPFQFVHKKGLMPTNLSVLRKILSDFRHDRFPFLSSDNLQVWKQPTSAVN